MFKRRKFDDLPATGHLPQADDSGVSEALLEGGMAAFDLAVAPPAASVRRDTGFGVPPRPIAKEVPDMGRSPFPPAPSSNHAANGLGSSGTTSNAIPGPGNPASVRPGNQPAQRRDAAERRTLVVGRGISVQGTVTDAERLVVEGTVEASMIHAAELVIASGGVFKGEVEVEDTEIAGTFDGTLTARGNLVVRDTGRVLGTARCRRLQVEDGGQITGRIEMLTEAARTDPARPSNESPAA